MTKFNNKKGFAIIPAILILAGILVFGGGIAYFVNKEKKIQQPVATDETANWQTYKNNEYGFEFKYPNYFKINNLSLSSKDFIINISQNVKYKLDWDITKECPKVWGGPTVFIKEIELNSNKIKVRVCQEDIGKGLFFTALIPKDNNQTRSIQGTFVFFEGDSSYQLKDHNFKIFEQIIATFKFTK